MDRNLYIRLGRQEHEQLDIFEEMEKSQDYEELSINIFHSKEVINQLFANLIEDDNPMKMQYGLVRKSYGYRRVIDQAPLELVELLIKMYKQDKDTRMSLVKELTRQAQKYHQYPSDNNIKLGRRQYQQQDNKLKAQKDKNIDIICVVPNNADPFDNLKLAEQKQQQILSNRFFNVKEISSMIDQLSRFSNEYKYLKSRCTQIKERYECEILYQKNNSNELLIMSHSDSSADGATQQCYMEFLQQFCPLIYQNILKNQDNIFIEYISSDFDSQQQKQSNIQIQPIKDKDKVENNNKIKQFEQLIGIREVDWNRNTQKQNKQILNQLLQSSQYYSLTNIKLLEINNQQNVDNYLLNKLIQLICFTLEYLLQKQYQFKYIIKPNDYNHEGESILISKYNNQQLLKIMESNTNIQRLNIILRSKIIHYLMSSYYQLSIEMTIKDILNQLSTLLSPKSYKSNKISKSNRKTKEQPIQSQLQWKMFMDEFQQAQTKLFESILKAQSNLNK